MTEAIPFKQRTLANETRTVKIKVPAVWRTNLVNSITAFAKMGTGVPTANGSALSIATMKGHVVPVLIKTILITQITNASVGVNGLAIPVKFLFKFARTIPCVCMEGLVN